MAEADALRRDREFAAAGAVSLASAVVACPVATDQAKELARIVLADAVALRHDEPREAASIAATFNRQMDAVIDSCNRSKNRRERSSRRTDLARDLDDAGLVLVDRAVMADLLIPRMDFIHGGTVEFAVPDDAGSFEQLRSLEDPDGTRMRRLSGFAAPSRDCDFDPDFPMPRFVAETTDVDGFMEGATGTPALDPNVND